MDDTITTTFAPLLGLACWRVERVQGSMLSFEFGAPRLVVREPYVSTSSSPKVQRSARRRLVKPVGEWSLFVGSCHWRVISSGEVVADDDGSHEQIEAAARVIDGQKLTEFKLDVFSRQTGFSFDLGATLTTRPYETDEEEQWSLYLPGRRVLTYRADGFFSTGAADEKPEEAVWQALLKSICIP